MAPAATAAVLLGLIALAAPVRASSLTSLEQVAGRCLASPGAAGCRAFWDLSDQLKQRADRTSQLRCYTSLLTLEAMVARATLGAPDPSRQALALQDIAQQCS